MACWSRKLQGYWREISLGMIMAEEFAWSSAKEVERHMLPCWSS